MGKGVRYSTGTAASSGNPYPFRSTMLDLPCRAGLGLSAIKATRRTNGRFPISTMSKCIAPTVIVRTLVNSKPILDGRIWNTPLRDNINFCLHKQPDAATPRRLPREASEGTAEFLFLVTSLWNDKEVTRHQARRVVARPSGVADSKKSCYPPPKNQAAEDLIDPLPLFHHSLFSLKNFLHVRPIKRHAVRQIIPTAHHERMVACQEVACARAGTADVASVLPT